MEAGRLRWYCAVVLGFACQTKAFVSKSSTCVQVSPVSTTKAVHEVQTMSMPRKDSSRCAIMFMITPPAGLRGVHTFGVPTGDSGASTGDSGASTGDSGAPAGAGAATGDSGVDRALLRLERSRSMLGTCSMVWVSCCLIWQTYWVCCAVTCSMVWSSCCTGLCSLVSVEYIV